MISREILGHQNGWPSKDVCFMQLVNYKKNSVACSPQANYTNRATAAFRRSQCQLFPIGFTWSAQRIPTVVNLSSLDRSRYSLEIAFNYSHEAEWTPFQTHYFSENLVVPGIEPGTSGSVGRNSDH
jgi:hypothetical protein